MNMNHYPRLRKFGFFNGARRSLAGALCGAFVFAIAPANLAWAQTCDPPCRAGQNCVPINPKAPEGAGRCVPGGRPPLLPAPTSVIGLAVVSVGREVYVFATADNGHVLYTFFQTGGAGAGGWFDLGDKVLTDAAPAAAAVPDPAGTYMFVWVRDKNTKAIKLNQGSPDAFNWVGWD